jgi:cytochrome c556
MKEDRMRSTLFCAAALAAPLCLVLSGCAQTSRQAEAAPAFKPVVSINEAMVDIIDHNSHILWNAADEAKAPKTDADWHMLEHAATTLAAAGSIMAVGGSGPQDAKWAKETEWAKLNQDMTNAALKMRLAVQSRNLPGVLAAGDELVASCEACHAQYKLTIPAHVATPAQQPEHFGHTR